MSQCLLIMALISPWRNHQSHVEVHQPIRHSYPILAALAECRSAVFFQREPGEHSSGETYSFLCLVDRWAENCCHVTSGNNHSTLKLKPEPIVCVKGTGIDHWLIQSLVGWWHVWSEEERWVCGNFCGSAACPLNEDTCCCTIPIILNGHSCKLGLRGC